MVAPKRKKMACQRSMTKKKKREKGVAMSQKKRDRDDSREKTIASRSKPHPSTHPSIHSHTCTFRSRLHDLFLHGSSLWLYNIWNASMPCSYPTLSSTKALSIVGKTEGNYCPGEDNKSWVLRENHFGELSHIFKNPLQNISRRIADL